MLKNIFTNKLWKSRLYSTGSYYRRFNSKKSDSFGTMLVDRTSRRYLTVVFGGGLLFYVAHLEEAPVTNRTRFIWLPHSLELAIGKYTYRSILNQTQDQILPLNHPLTKKVSKIFQRIVDAAQSDPTVDLSLISGIEWKIHVVNDPKAPPNAFVLPGGKVFVFSSILNICKNDDGLATVLSHEFAHQLARHTAENLSKAPVYTALSIFLYVMTGVDSINRLLLDGLIKMPASREMETEADYIGLMIMSKACFHPEESVKLWQRMATFEQQHKNRHLIDFEFLSTHPNSSKRIENMLMWLPEANTAYSQSNCSTIGRHYNNFQSNFGMRSLF